MWRSFLRINHGRSMKPKPRIGRKEIGRRTHVIEPFEGGGVPHKLNMNRNPLKSSKCRAVRYRERLMEIEFVNGDVYENNAVSPELCR